MALAYLGVVMFGFIVLFIQTYTTEYTGQRAMHDLRMEIFSHLQTQDMAYFDRNPVGRLMTRTVNDVETLNELFSTGVVGLLGDVSIVFGIAAVMLWLDWQLALVCLAAFPVILYISRFYRRRAREVYRESRLILAGSMPACKKTSPAWRRFRPSVKKRRCTAVFRRSISAIAMSCCAACATTRYFFRSSKSSAR